MTTPSRPGKNTDDRRPPVVIRDKPRIDPQTSSCSPASNGPPRTRPMAGTSRASALPAPSPGRAPAGAGGESLRVALAERTTDL